MSDLYADLLNEIRRKCGNEQWWGPADFKPRNSRSLQASLARSKFLCERATEEQLEITECMLGFPLFPLLRALLKNLANGGFGPGGGLRGAVGGYGTAETPVPLRGKNVFLNDETLVKFHHNNAELVELAHYADQWKQGEQRRWVNLPYDVFPRQLFPICDVGDVVEVCLNREGHVFRWGLSDKADFVYSISDQGISFEQWIRKWLEE